MPQVIIKIPKGKKNLNPANVLKKAQAINPRVGEIRFENEDYISYGFVQATSDVSAFTRLISKFNEHRKGNSVTITAAKPNKPENAPKVLTEIFPEVEVLVFP